MGALIVIPLTARLVALFVLGACLGGLVNWAVYRFAWFSRSISPWMPPDPAAPPRRWSDRLPVVGWLGLRREAAVFGPGHWLRPMLLEILLGLGLAALYWWEVERQGLILNLWVINKAGIIAFVGDFAPNWRAPAGTVHAIYLAHVILILFMIAASFIDIDEKLIPDEVSVTGTLLGLVLAIVLPASLLPQVAERDSPPALGTAIEAPGGIPAVGPLQDPLYLEGVTAAAPNDWPAEFAPRPNLRSLAIGWACYWFWCFALTPRIWRGSRGWSFALQLIAIRVVRELKRPPLVWIALVGTAVIAAVWWQGGAAWIGLLTALLGMAVTGLFVWGTRIACSTALGVEALGFGDVTLMMMIAAFLGWQAGILVFFVAPLAGLVVGGLQYLLVRDNVIPYGPFLCLAAVVAVVAWAPLWNYAQFYFSWGWLVPVVLGVCLVLMWIMLTVWSAIKRRIF